MNTKTIGTYVLERLETGTQATARYPKAALRKARAMGGTVEVSFMVEANPLAETTFTRIDPQLTDEAAMRELKRMQRDPLL
jgi:hypothetical protein